ncbi:histidinol-phosphate transaminase [Dehalococcoidia bacterium]|nr:histidinol-phosphate transaminase [Dehalococcoidia bacterium]
MDILEKLIRPHLTDLKPYESVNPVEVPAERAGIPAEQVIKLDMNENPYGCSPRVQRALGEAGSYHIYPDPSSRKLRRLLGEYTGFDPEYIAVGSGSDELIDLILRLTLEPGDRVINCPPTFGMYPFSTGVCGGEIVNVPRGPDYSIDVAAIKSAVDRRTRVVFIASPNNPTGNLTSEGDILQLLETGVLVVVDEAYYEFAGASVAHLVPSHPNLIVLRTFSKWAGLAGLRVGYGILSPQINEVIHRMKLPYNVTIAAQIAARESLADMDYLQGRIKAILAERERLFQGLKVQGILDPIPSKGNFLLCRVVKGEALEIKQGLERRGILVRYYDVHRLRDKLRISVGKPEHTDALLLALSDC